jgi:UDP-2,4-diacetamido-2,4,6-trideoxy-beta-L-altropyranose hydrolase
MKVVFRVDASLRIGTGHVMRCITLARWLRERGAEICFVCREHAGNLLPLLRSRGMPVTVLRAPAASDAADGDSHAAWLGVSQAVDATQTIEALGGAMPDWLVVDHYALDAQWERQLRAHVGRLMVIDDLADRCHDCDLLLDANFSLERGQRYADRVPAACRRLLGPWFALLQPEYGEYRRKLRERSGCIGRVLVFFGGSDLQDMTAKTLEALSNPDLAHLEVDVVLGADNARGEALARYARQRPRTTVHGPRPHLADLMARADVAIGAGGATTWERMCLGLPSVVVAIAKNQQGACEALEKEELIYYAGQSPDVSAARLEQLLRSVIPCSAGMLAMAGRNRIQVDGLGAARLVEAMHPSPTHETRLRPARKDDMVAYYHWTNDPETRGNAIDTSPISWATHEAWFTARLLDADTRLFVFEAAGLAVGQIRFEMQGDTARISYSLESFVRGRGWGTRLVALGMDSMRQTAPVRMWAQVKAGNDASSAVFLRLGFTETTGSADGGLRWFSLDRTRRPS